MRSKKQKIEDKICALIPSDDFKKVLLLTTISKEEGANYTEIRIDLEDDLFLLKDLSSTKFKIIFSINPDQIIPENRDKIVEKIKQIANYEPYAIEINTNLSSEVIPEVFDFLKKQEIRIHLAKYFTSTTKITIIRNTIKDMVKLKADTIKIVTPIQTDFEALELFSLYHKFPNSELILVPSGETNKFAQIQTVFLGGKYTYGYISRKSSEALLPINLLKQNLELLNKTTEEKLF
ncbi:MAG: type I 3-dehydroquinate dehydratase [Candidatus Heimdallarchaeota archaeon]